jgi:hypothetical protein
MPRGGSGRGVCMNSIGIKRALRELKRLERKLRSGLGGGNQPPLAWDRFFDLRGTGKAKYGLRALEAMSREEYRQAIREYWAYVFRSLVDEAEFRAVRFEPDVLLQWGLPPDADETAVKQRFRELAKRCHPDTGGTAEEFINLMRNYRKLTGK